MLRRLLPLLLFALPACSAIPDASSPSTAIVQRPLKLASWNLEFLAEKDGTGCAPRSEADYAAMRRIVESLDADVIAFQEAENLKAAARVFDPARYSIIMEERSGAPSGTCGGAARIRSSR